MSCTKHFSKFQWERHSWRQRVTAAEQGVDHATNMWGRAVNGGYVRCRKQDVCETCGKVRRDVSCFCDSSYAEHCTIYRAWIDGSRHAASSANFRV